MKPLSHISLRNRLLLLVMLVFLPALALVTYQNLRARQGALDQARLRNQVALEQILFKQSDIFTATRHLLTVVAKLPFIRDQDRTHSFLVILKNQFPLYSNLGLIDPRGRLLVSTVPISGPVHFSDREWFDRVRRTGQFTVSEYVLGRITGRPIMVFVQPVLDKNGKITGVVFASLELTWFETLAKQAALPADYSISIVDPRGKILSRYPHPEKWTGFNQANSPLFKKIISKQKGEAEESGPDGIRRLYTFGPLTHEGETIAYAVVGLPKSKVFGEVNRWFILYMVILGLAMVLSLFSAWYFGKSYILDPANRLVKTAEKLSEGDLSARSNLTYHQGEIGTLARTFDRMAESLQQRESRQKELEATIKKNETRFRSLIENSSDIIFELNPEGVITYISPSVGRITGYQAQEMIGKSSLDYIHPDDREKIVESFGQGFASPGLIVSLEYRSRQKDGSWVYLEGTGKVITDDLGQRKGIASIRDVSERMQAAHAQKRIEGRLQIVLDTAPFGAHVFELLEDGRFIFVGANQKADEILGFEHRRLLGQTIEEAFPGVVGAERLEAFRRVAALGERYDQEEVAYESPELRGIFDLHAFQTDRNRMIVFFLEVSERINSREKLNRKLEQQAALRSIDMAITASLDLRVTFSVFLDQVVAQLKVDAADVLMLDPHTFRLEYAAGRGFETKALQYTQLALGEGHAGRAALERKMVWVEDLEAMEDSFRRSPLFTREGFLSYFGYPLIAKGQVVGVLEVFFRKFYKPDQEWLDFFEALAGQAAIAIDNATLFIDLQKTNLELLQAYDTTLEGWSRALDLKDHETEGHSRRVTELTVQVARALGLGNNELIDIRRGALLHDIGKMGVPDQILLKAGPLSEEEWQIMRQHPVYAYELLYPIPFLRRTLDIPYSHHEKWDGSGYPRGLKGEQIPLAGRIFAVVDVWDALTSDRPYRPAWDGEKALDHIVQGAGSHFDPRVAEVFLTVIRERSDPLKTDRNSHPI
ncbi:MAG: HD domain-containing phosphohydrolase [Thermodesulfobacteriota bacterium]